MRRSEEGFNIANTMPYNIPVGTTDLKRYAY
jgi:hypothetical protein